MNIDVHIIINMKFVCLRDGGRGNENQTLNSCSLQAARIRRLDFGAAYIAVYMYICIYVYNHNHWLFLFGCSYAYSRLSMHLQWAAPMPPPHVLGSLRPSGLGRTAPRPPHMGAGHGRGPLHAHRQMRIGIGIANGE